MSDDGRVFAALEVLGWPDDRKQSAHVEEGGYEVVPAGHYWSLVCDVLAAADLAAELDRGDLPEGQQSNLGPFFNESADDLNVSIRKLVAGLDTLGIRPYADNAPSWSWVMFCLDGIEKLQREVARVRADTLRQFAELMRVRAEEAPADEPAKWPFSAYALAAVKADEYASKGFPSAVEPLTPTSAPSDVAAPRDALTDQDFTNLNATIKGARGPELFAREGQSACGAPHPLGGPACQRGVDHDTHLRRVSGGSEGWRALPEDEGTRWPGVTLNDAQEEADEMIAQEGTTDVEY